MQRAHDEKVAAAEASRHHADRHGCRARLDESVRLSSSVTSSRSITPGPSTSGLHHTATVRNISKGNFGGRTLTRLGLSFAAERTPPGATTDRRRADRFACAETLPATATAMSPLFFREWLHFSIRQFAAGGATLATSIRNKGLLLGSSSHSK